MTTKLEGILAGPAVDYYHELGKEFTTPQKEAEYVKELTKLLTVIKDNPSLKTYLDDAKENITSELGSINEADQVVAKLVEDGSGFEPSALSSIFSSHTDFQEMFMGDTVVQESVNVGLTTEQASKASKASETIEAPDTGTNITSAEKRSTSEVVTQRNDLSGGFRKTNKRRNKKGRKRSKGTRKK